jgi:hypothetical protein
MLIFAQCGDCGLMSDWCSVLYDDEDEINLSFDR